MPIDEVAARLLAAHDAGTTVEPVTTGDPSFDMDAAYEVLGRIGEHRRAAGWRMVGRKAGFTNRTLWALYGVDEPFWAPVWDRTVVNAEDGMATLSLDGLVQPRLEPEVVFGLRGPVPETGGAAAVLEQVEWLAAGFEVVQSPYPDWRFTLPDCVAASGLHAALVVGGRLPMAGIDIADLAARLATFEATLRRDGDLVMTGTGANVLDSPALALQHVARVVGSQPAAEPLGAGELVTTGSVTDAAPVGRGETWTSDYGMLGVDGLTVTFS